MTKRSLVSVGAAALLLLVGARCSAPGTAPEAAHTHETARAEHKGRHHGEDAMRAHMREMEQALGEVRAVLQLTQNVATAGSTALGVISQDVVHPGAL